ncbi:MAG: hypothetical protein ACUVT1_03895 [Anaerolineae bacterium]
MGANEYPPPESAGKLDLLIMLGDTGTAFPEQLLGAVREAVAMDLVTLGLSLAGVERVIVSTNRASFMDKLAPLPVLVIPDEPKEEFHFGRHLQRILQAAHITGGRRVLYMGGGAAPLISPAQFQMLVDTLQDNPHALVTNNLYSSDLVGFTAGWLDEVEPPARDNDLAWKLAEMGKHEVLQPPRSAGTSFDVDTITDMLILKLCRERLHPYTREAIDALPADASMITRALEVLRDPRKTLLLVGRVSADVWQVLRRRAACQVRVISEERGMRASGRLARGEVHSLVGYYAGTLGFAGLFKYLGQLANAVILDSRVLFAHLEHWPSDADRCYADLGQPDKIEDPVIRELIQAALEAPIPVAMGGHSLLSGGLLALLESMGL